jgi:hypothetical protein
MQAVKFRQLRIELRIMLGLKRRCFCKLQFGSDREVRLVGLRIRMKVFLESCGREGRTEGRTSTLTWVVAFF